MLCTVEVEQGRAVAFFPFDGERQSMIWADKILLAGVDNLDSTVCGAEDFLSLSARYPAMEHAMYAYSIEQRGGEYILRLLR